MSVKEPIFDPAAFDQFHQFWGEDAPAVIQEIVPMFFQETPPAIQAIEEAYERGDWDAVRQTAHRLKSSCATVGAAALASLCREIEAAAEAGDTSRLATLVPRLRELYTQSTQALEDFLATLSKSA